MAALQEIVNSKEKPTRQVTRGRWTDFTQHKERETDKKEEENLERGQAGHKEKERWKVRNAVCDKNLKMEAL